MISHSDKHYGEMKGGGRRQSKRLMTWAVKENVSLHDKSQPCEDLGGERYRLGAKAKASKGQQVGRYGVCSTRVRRPQRRSMLDGKGLPTPVCWPHWRSLTLLEFHLYIAKILDKEYVIYVYCLKRTFGTLNGSEGGVGKQEWKQLMECRSQ